MTVSAPEYGRESLACGLDLARRSAKESCLKRQEGTHGLEPLKRLSSIVNQSPASPGIILLLKQLDAVLSEIPDCSTCGECGLRVDGRALLPTFKGNLRP